MVLARELTLREMEYICSHVSARCEAFVHGAHCMSVSGACYLSAMLGGRSGNRGLCAQPCRLDWQCGGEGYALSLKDMSLLPHVREMENAGVGILKIEGRMKRPEYVAAAVTACRQALAGEPYDADRLRAVFSRSGFTDGYLTGRRNAEMFGSRTKEDVTGAEKVLRELAALYEKETPRVGVSMAFSMVLLMTFLLPAQYEAKLSFFWGIRVRSTNQGLPMDSLYRDSKLMSTLSLMRSIMAEVSGSRE